MKPSEEVIKEVLNEVYERNKNGEYDLDDLWDFDKMLEDTAKLTLEKAKRKFKKLVEGLLEEIEKKAKQGKGIEDYYIHWKEVVRLIKKHLVILR